jgi:sugar lactone lactonase YvrE
MSAPSAPTIDIDSLQDVGDDLNRPECVLCTADGSLFVSDWAGGVCQIEPNGRQTRFLAADPFIDLKPNGIALQPDGSFLLANLGDDGGVWRLKRNGDVQPYVVEIDNRSLPPTNFVVSDHQGRTWISVSTQLQPRADAYRPNVCDGFVIVVDRDGARIAAEGLGYANEIQVHPSGEWVYVNETFARRTSRFRILGSNKLGKPETVAEFGRGTFPDGLCFDEAGGVWIVSIVSNRVIHVDQEGNQTVVLEDADEGHLDWVEDAFQSGNMGRPHLDTIRSKRLHSVSSIAFGGAERRLSYLGCLLGSRIVAFEAPVAGVEPAHWHWHTGQAH